MVNLLELENFINKEIESYSELEYYLVQKKNALINSDLEQLKNIDTSIRETFDKIKRLAEQRLVLTGDKKIYDFLFDLKNDINKKRILSKSNKLKNKAKSIKKLDFINTELLKHSMKMVEGTVDVIVSAFKPQVSSYNNLGRKNDVKSSISLSSIVEDA